jgi:hypothetical protein
LSAFADQSLPPPLAAAIEEFREWMRGEQLAEEVRSAPHSPLYHYTPGEAGLRGILEKRKLWCFIHNRQKDQEEVRYSLNIARQVIRQEADRGPPPVCRLLRGLDDLLANNCMEEMFDYYFFSLSAHRDHFNQWAEYGDGGRGFAIGFSPALFQIDRYELAPRANENVFVSPVTYGRDATRTRHRDVVRKLAEIVGRVEQANRPLVSGGNLQVWYDEMNKDYIATMLIWSCLTAKAAQFQDEQETRYIILGVRQIFDDCRKQHNGRDYVDTPLPLSEPGNITEVLVGPQAPAGAEGMVRDLLQSSGYPPGIPVSRSKASLG